MSARAHVMRPQTFRTFTVPPPRQLPCEVFRLRVDTPKEVLAAEADTQGWDSASAVRLSQVNRALANTGVSPAAFNQAVDANWSINGTFGPWSMTRGGSGAIVFLRTPIPSATLAFNGATTQITGATAAIQVKLQYLPQLADEVPPDPTRGDPNDLVTNPSARSADDPAVVVNSIDYGQSVISDLDKALFTSAIAKWYNANLAQFAYVFAVVSLNQVASSPQFQWLKPTYTSYAYYDGPREDPSEDVAYFGALTMNGRTPVRLANQLPAAAIPAGEGAALLIGMRLFMENMVLPGVTAAFPGSGPSDFKVTNGNTAVQLGRNLDMEKVRVGLVDYQPTAEEFTLQIIGDEIQVRSKIHVPISPGIDAYVVNEAYYRLELVPQEGGAQTIGWTESRPPKSDTYTVKAAWVTITEAVVAIVGAVAAVVAGAILSGILRVVVVIIIAVIAGISAALPEIIAKAISEGAAKALPSLQDMLTELLAPVQWPDTAGFILSRAELNGSLQLSGSFVNAAQARLAPHTPGLHLLTTRTHP